MLIKIVVTLKTYLMYIEVIAYAPFLNTFLVIFLIVYYPLKLLINLPKGGSPSHT